MNITTKTLNKLSGISKPQKKFLLHIFTLYFVIRGRVNFLNMSRYSKYSEKSFRLHFEKKFDFFKFNSELVKEHCSKKAIIAIDCSFISKSGKKTPDKGCFWSGVASKALPGLEISTMAVVDMEHNTAIHLESIQTPSNCKNDESRLDFYYNQIYQKREELIRISKYIVCDGFYAKNKFVNGVVKNTELNIISKFRFDANMRYLYTGPKIKGKKGRPKEYDGKIDWKNINKTKFSLDYEDEDIIIYSAIVNSVSLKLNVKLAYLFIKSTNTYILLFSTDLELDGYSIFLYYKARFQIEFLFRDGKQFTGLNHCQARSKNKLNFHFNTSLTAISLAKVEHYFGKKKEKRSYSMADIKTFYHNKFMVDRIFSNLEIDHTCKKIKNLYQDILNIGKIAS